MLCRVYDPAVFPLGVWPKWFGCALAFVQVGLDLGQPDTQVLQGGLLGLQILRLDLHVPVGHVSP